MAVKLFGGLVAVVLAIGVGVTQLWPEEPEGCPEDGCRVGYRFEDGGKDPEGWEPYQTDDPVVALMDACLTYFMTGSLQGSPVIATRAQGVALPGLDLEVWGLNALMAIRNYPGSQWSTFECKVVQVVPSQSFLAVEEWMNARFLEDGEWRQEQGWRNEGDILFDQPWFRAYRNDSLEVRVTILNWEPIGKDGLHLSVRLFADYFGPTILSGPNDITF